MGPALNCPRARGFQDLSCCASRPQTEVTEPQPDQGIETKGGDPSNGIVDVGSKKCAWPLCMLGRVWEFA